MTGQVPLPCSTDELDAVIESLRSRLWYAKVRDLDPSIDCWEKHWERTVPAHLVVAATAAARDHWQERCRVLNREVAVLREALYGARAAAQRLVDAVPDQEVLFQ